MAVISPLALQRAQDASGNVVFGATLAFYQAGTTTPVAVYADIDGRTSLGTSLSSDSFGYFPVHYLDEQQDYKAVITVSGFSRTYDWLRGSGSTDATTFGQVADIPALRGKTWAGVERPDIVVLVNNWSAGDGGGLFRWDSTSTATDDGGITIKETATTTGRWVRQFSQAEIAPEWFGARGDGTTNDQAAVQSAVTAAVARQGSVRLSRMYAVGSEVLAAGGNFSIYGLGPRTGLTMLGSSSYNGLRVESGGGLGNTKTLTADVAKGVTVLPLNNVSGLAVGDVLVITATISGYARQLNVEITNIVSLNVTISHPLPWSIVIASTTYQIAQTALPKNITLENFAVRRGANTGTTSRGIYINNSMESRFWDLTVDGFESAGFASITSLNTTVKVYARRSGSASEGAVQIVGHTGGSLVDCISHYGRGFGINIALCCYMSTVNMQATQSVGRGVKRSACHFMSETNTIAVGNSFTGNAWTDGCTDCVSYGGTSARNGDFGLWFNGNFNSDITVSSHTVLLNGSSGGNQNISIGTNDTRINVVHLEEDGLAHSCSSATSMICPATPLIMKAHRNGVDLARATGAALAVPMTTAAIDTASTFDSVNGRFLCKHPGWYRAKFRFRMSADPTNLLAYIYRNGLTAEYDEWSQAAGADVNAHRTIVWEGRLEIGDTIAAFIFHNWGSDLNVLGATQITTLAVEQIR